MKKETVGNYCVVTGFNSKQLWVYNDLADVYIDPPENILDEINSRFERYEWENKEKALMDIIRTSPSWLKDTTYYYSGNMDI